MLWQFQARFTANVEPLQWGKFLLVFRGAMVKKPRGGAVSLRQIAAGLNERSIATPRRGEWSGVEVQHVLSLAV
jgi:hypothetical protein